MRMILDPIRHVPGHRLDVCANSRGGDVGVARLEPLDHICSGKGLAKLAGAVTQELMNRPVVLQAALTSYNR